MPEERTGNSEPVFEDVVIPGGINRCAKVIKGGRRFSFSAVVVVGNRAGRVGYGFGKANEVPMAVEKARKNAMKNLIDVPVLEGTIPHTVWGRYGASKVLLKPASAGTGVIAGTTNNPVNLLKATFEALRSLRSPEEVERLRGVKVRRVVGASQAESSPEREADGG